MTRAETFNQLIRQYQQMHPEDQADISLGEYIAENFDLIGMIRNGVATVRTDRLDLEADYKKQRETLDQRLASLQARCPHIDVDMPTLTCNLCGAKR